MVAGGVGVAPFLILTDRLKKLRVRQFSRAKLARSRHAEAWRTKSQELILLYGGRSKEFTFPMTDFKKNGCKVYVSTDDGSFGVRGRVSELFSRINPDPKTTYLYACGPRPMMKSVQDFAKKYDLKGQVSCEEVMACGLGACLGCVISTKSGYKTVCHDGPVFNLNEIIF